MEGKICGLELQFISCGGLHTLFSTLPFSPTLSLTPDITTTRPVHGRLSKGDQRPRDPGFSVRDASVCWGGVGKG